MDFEATAPVTPRIPDDHPLGTQEKEKDVVNKSQDNTAKVPRESEAVPMAGFRAPSEFLTPIGQRPGKEPATKGIDVGKLSFEWDLSEADQDVLRSVSDTIAPPHLEGKLKDAPSGNLFDQARMHLTKVGISACFEFFILRI